MSKLVYLAGPITGLSFDGAVDWRKEAVISLAKEGITGLSPMRGKEYLESIATNGNVFTSDGDKYSVHSPLSTNRGITTRDHWDATRCDVVFANLLNAPSVSIGTVMEIAWAYTHRIPVVAVATDNDIHWKHGMIKEAVGFHVTTLDEGLNLVKAIFRY